MKKIFLLAVVPLALASCDNNADNPTPTEAARITASIGDGAASRAENTEWAAGDQIGISSTVGGVTGPYINLLFTTTGNAKFYGDIPIYFLQPMTLNAYYPYTGEPKTAPGDNGIITANTRPANQTPANRPNIDFMWDSKTGENKKDFSAAKPDVNFTFAHKMSKLTFTFWSSGPAYDQNDVLISEAVDVSTMIAYEITGLGVEGTFDTNTGVCAIDEAKGREGLKMTFAKASAGMNEREMSPLIVFPQKNDEGFNLLITTDELAPGSPTQHYKCALRFTDNEIKPGCHYNFNVQVTRRGLIIGDMTIKRWESAPERFITATIDGGGNGIQEK